MLKVKFWCYATLCLVFSAAGFAVLFRAVSENQVGSRGLTPMLVFLLLMVPALLSHRAACKFRGAP